MATFKDRQSIYPGRYKITAKDGSSYYVTIERADDAVEEGTPLNAATFNSMVRELKAYSDARNLLDNSNFAHPVNQRGAEIYTGAVQYTIDRWMVASAIDVYLADGYISLACSGEATGRNGFSQWFAEEKTPEPGAVITIAYEDDGGNIYVDSVEMPESGSIAVGDTNSPGVRVYSAAEGARVSMMIPPGTSYGLKWMAVYEGKYTLEDIPPYRRKDYSAELMECMRYYQVRSTNNVAAVDLRPTMRVSNPTITKVDNGYAYSADL